MNVRFDNENLTVKPVTTSPGRFRFNDLLVGPDGILLKVVSVCHNAPTWESNFKTKCVVLLETENHVRFVVDSLTGKYNVMRPKS